MSPDDPTKQNGSHDPDDDEDDPLQPDPPEPGPDTRDAPAPEPVAELAAACVRFVATRYKVPLDFTPDTLSLVDQYVKDARAELLVKPESLDLLQASIGAYLGETLRRTFGAQWFFEGDHDGWRLDFTYVYLTFNPIGMAREALTLAAADGWHPHLETDPGESQMLAQRLAIMGAMEEDEYYLPTTRFDVVEVAVDTLRARMIQDGNGDVTFGREDYTR